MAKRFDDFVREERGAMLSRLIERRGGIRGLSLEESAARRREAEEELEPLLDVLRVYHDWLTR